MGKEETEIRFYYIDSVRWIHTGNKMRGLYQFGCGLNLMTGYATLCTCKHRMLKDIHRDMTKRGKRLIYVAALGDTNGRRPNSRRSTPPLVFLGKVKQSFGSFLDLWRDLPKSIRAAKNVRFNNLGDLYPPSLVRKPSRDKFSEQFAHRKRKNYKKDIRDSKPIIFREWQAWPDGEKVFHAKYLKRLAFTDTRKKFRSMIRVPKPAASGWKYQFHKLEPLIRRAHLTR
jgi:hypothetical protein